MSGWLIRMARHAGRGAVVAVLGWAVGAAPAAAGVPENARTDDLGRAVAFAEPPQRIVSLLPSLTETVCALGACDKLVGVDRYSNWPADLPTRLPQLGGGLDPHVEAIVALQPDVVLLANAPRVVARLEALGLRTMALEPRTQADVYRAMHSIGLMLGLAPQHGAQQQWQRIQQGIEAAAQSIPQEAHGHRVYFEVSRGPYVAGPASFLGELLTRLHMGNVVPDGMGPFPRLNPEFMVRARPDVILMGSYSMQVAHNYPGWSNLEAVKRKRVCAFSPEQSALLVRPGPRMDESAHMLAQCLIEKAPRRVR